MAQDALNLITFIHEIGEKMRADMEHLEHKDHLGDGVYVGFDGYQIILWLEDESCAGPNAIAMEEHTLQALDRYLVRIGRKMELPSVVERQYVEGLPGDGSEE